MTEDRPQRQEAAGPAPQPPPAPLETLPKEVRNWAMLCHLSALTGLFGNGIGFLLGPFVVWIIKREDHPFIDEHGKQAINFQLTMLIAALVCIPLIFVLIGLLLLPLIGVVDVILTVVASLKASNGERYRYPIALPLLS